MIRLAVSNGHMAHSNAQPRRIVPEKLVVIDENVTGPLAYRKSRLDLSAAIAVLKSDTSYDPVLQRLEKEKRGPRRHLDRCRTHVCSRRRPYVDGLVALVDEEGSDVHVVRRKNLRQLETIHEDYFSPADNILFGRPGGQLGA